MTRVKYVLFYVAASATGLAFAWYVYDTVAH